jgi:hypothetical protein
MIEKWLRVLLMGELLLVVVVEVEVIPTGAALIM